MLRIIVIILFLSSLSFSGFIGQAQTGPSVASTDPAAAARKNEDPVVLSIGGRQLKASELEKRIDALPINLRSFYKNQGKRQFVDELVRMDLLTGEAIRRKLENDPEVQSQLEMARSSILAAAAMRAVEKEIQVSDEAARSFYAAHSAEFEEVRLRQILVRSSKSLPDGSTTTNSMSPDEARSKAEGLRKQILSGADFAELAQKNSDDLASARNGGDLGFVRRGMNVPPFEKVAFALKPGQVSEVVETPFGFHVVKMEAVRTFEEVKSQVISRLQQINGKEKLAELVKQLNPVINEAYFKVEHGRHASEPMPSFELAAPRKGKSREKGNLPNNGAKP
ncbi:MAG: peptidylprolyl isomerase [Acidobacteria bacterium]|nr:peptidylprolyl isomerase [Acidobacteriota bacterium]MBI3657680.1 peptidylprolyl isomerase [Acidobacteriota bacterium]